jgi:hypothetical protein
MVRKSGPKEITVKTDNDTYILKRPTGALGWKHFRMLMEIENERKNCIVEKRPDPVTGDLVDYMLPNPRLDTLMTEVLDRWIEQILPNVITSHDFEDVPWSDLLLLFQAISGDSSIDTTNFRDIPEQ